jgi:phosphatidylserine decarboxylase
MALKLMLLSFTIALIVYYPPISRNGDTDPMKSLLKILPHHLFSSFTGFWASFPLPRVCRKPLFDWYINRYGVRLQDIETDPYSFPSLAKFFVRDLKPGIRPIQSEIVSPVDGTLRSFGDIDAGTVLEVKNQQYAVSELLGSEALAANFSSGSFFNFYLAPGDYHHVHVPITGEVHSLSYIPGRLWPVNTWAWGNITSLLIRNERVAAIFETELGRVAVVMIGALNVGSIGMVVPELEPIVGAPDIRTVSVSPLKLKAGDRLGTFYMGSSVVVLFQSRFKVNSALNPEQKVVFGQSLQ